MKWMAPPRTPAELAERDRILAGRTSISEPTVSINIGFGPDIPIFPDVAVMSRVTHQEREMTTQEKIDYLKALNTKGAEQVNASTKAGEFDLKGQFTAPTVAAVMARNAEVRPQRPRTPTKVIGAFDSRRFGPVAVRALFSDAGRDDFSDDRSNSPRDDYNEPTEHSDLGMAHDLISCEISGESGPGCGHNCDHIQRATECLQNFARDEAARKQHRDMAEKSTMVRFA